MSLVDDITEMATEQEILDYLNEEFLDEVPEEPMDLPEMLDNFTLESGRIISINHQEVSEFVLNLLSEHLRQERVAITAQLGEFLEAFLPPEASKRKLFSILRLCSGILSLSDSELSEAFDVEDATLASASSSIAVPGARCLYIRSYRMKVSTLVSILEDWTERVYAPDECAVWASHCQSVADQDALVYLRYVGQCQHPRTPLDRVAEDAIRKHGLLARFLQTASQIAPEVLLEAKVFAFNPVFEAAVTDDWERLLISLLDHKSLLNRQMGGLYDKYESSREEDSIMKATRTNVVGRWLESNNEAPVATYVIPLSERIARMEDWMQDIHSIILPFSSSYPQTLLLQSVPRLYKGQVIAVFVGRDVTAEDFLSGRSFLDAESEPPQPSRAGQKFLDLVYYLTRMEGTLARARPIKKITSLFPFVDLYPWLGKLFLPKAMEFLQSYFQTAMPILGVTLGEEPSSIAAANFVHANGLQGVYTPHVGKPRIASWADPSWLEDEDCVDPPEDTLYILIPHFDPGLFKHSAGTKELNRLYYFCWKVTFLFISKTMDALDSQVYSTGSSRRQLLDDVMINCTQIMESSGLQVALENARNELMTYWQNWAAQKMPTSSVSRTDETRSKNHDAALRNTQAAEMAMGDPNSPERMAQVRRLWKQNHAMLHIVWSHREEERAPWETFMCNVGHNKYFAMCMCREQQRVRGITEGRHPLAHVLGQYAPEDAANDDWMFDETLAHQAIGSHMTKMRSKIPSDFYSSARQRSRVLGREVTSPPTTIDGRIVHPDRSGRFSIYWTDPNDQSFNTLRFCHRSAHSVHGDNRILRVLPGGLGLQDDSQDYFKVERDGIQSILLVKSSEMRTKQGGAAILRAWQAERDGLYPGTEGDAGSQTSSLGRQSQEEISHLSNTTVTQLAITVYGDAEALARRGVDPVITSYHLPVHIADGVVPLKRFLDDFYPDGGTIFVGQSNALHHQVMARNAT
ncbi:unnamed protein product [Umbelopsis vinacea]